MTLCVNCKHFFESAPGDRRPFCVHPENLEQDHNNGGWKPIRPAKYMRMYHHECGPEGALFELNEHPKPEPGFDWAALGRALANLAILRWLFR